MIQNYREKSLNIFGFWMISVFCQLEPLRRTIIHNEIKSWWIVGNVCTCYLETYVYVREGDRPSDCPLVETFRKSHIRIVSSWELLIIWNSSNCSRNTRPECSCERLPWKHTLKRTQKHTVRTRKHTPEVCQKRWVRCWRVNAATLLK